MKDFLSDIPILFTIISLTTGKVPAMAQPTVTPMAVHWATLARSSECGELMESIPQSETSCME